MATKTKTKSPSVQQYKTAKAALFYRSLLLRAIVAGKARWESFVEGGIRGEVCVNGLRCSAELDETGCPLVNEHLAGLLYKAVGGFPMGDVR